TVLVMLRHRERAPVTLATIEVLVDDRVRVQKPILASRMRTFDWQRETASFVLEREGSTVIRVLSSGGRRFWTRTVSLCREPPRPFYAIAHMRNTPSGAARALRRGANAIECDVSAHLEHGGRIAVEAHHGFVIPYPRRSLVRTPLREYAAGLADLGERLALL